MLRWLFYSFSLSPFLCHSALPAIKRKHLAWRIRHVVRPHCMTVSLEACFISCIAFFPLTVLFCFSPKLLCFPFVFRLSHCILNFNQLKHQISHNMNRKLAFFQRDSAARCDFFCVCVVCVCVAPLFTSFHFHAQQFCHLGACGTRSRFKVL